MVDCSCSSSEDGDFSVVFLDAHSRRHDAVRRSSSRRSKGAVVAVEYARRHAAGGRSLDRRLNVAAVVVYAR